MTFASFLLGQGIFHPLSVESSILCERKMATCFDLEVSIPMERLAMNTMRSSVGPGPQGSPWALEGESLMTSPRQHSFGM